MAQNGPHGHQHQVAAAAPASDEGHTTAPPTTAAFSPMSAGAYGSGGSSSSAGNMETMDAGADMGKKNLIPDLNTEERDSAGDTIIKDELRSEEEAVEVPSADADADDTDIIIKFLKDELARLKEMLQQALAQQAADRVEASSSSFPFMAMPETAQGMALLCSLDAAQRADWGGGVPAVPPAAPAVPAQQVRFKTWSEQNMVLTVARDNAYISVCVPRRRDTLTSVTSVLDNHGIDMIAGHISVDSVRALFMIYAHVARTNGENRSSEEIYRSAVSEIMRLHSNNN